MRASRVDDICGGVSREVSYNLHERPPCTTSHNIDYVKLREEKMPERIYNNRNNYDKLKSLMKVLREECPWDQAQTIESLRRHTLEETHEVLEAIDRAARHDDWQPLKEELGDLLLQVLFYARIAEEHGRFCLDNVVDGLIEKMIRRHPHVFGDASGADIHRQWDRIKDAEHAERGSLMDGVPPLPALSRARKLQQRAARVGFDWNRPEDVLDKMREELDELSDEVNSGSPSQIEDEFGDVLFTLVNLARKLDVDAELALMRTNRKFADRFRLMERLAAERGLDLESMNLADMETLYQEAKAALELQN